MRKTLAVDICFWLTNRFAYDTIYVANILYNIIERCELYDETHFGIDFIPDPSYIMRMYTASRHRWVYSCKFFLQSNKSPNGSLNQSHYHKPDNRSYGSHHGSC